MKISADALLFDNDGTLISSLGSVDRCWARWAEEYGIPAEEFAKVELHGRTAVDIIRDVLPADQVPAALARIEQLEVEDVPNGGVVPLPGTAELLRSLPEGSWAVVTSATRVLAEARLRHLGIEAPLVIAADDITRGKPDPEPYLTAARMLGVRPGDCVAIEDSTTGTRSAVAAGCAVLVVPNHVHVEEGAGRAFASSLLDVDLDGLGALLPSRT